MNFKPSRYPSNSLYKESRILKISDFITLQNFLFAHDNLNKKLPKSLNKVSFSLTSSNVYLRGVQRNQIKRIHTRTILYGSQSITSKSIDAWNYVNNLLYHNQLHLKSKYVCKQRVTNFLLDKYEPI